MTHSPAKIALAALLLSVLVCVYLLTVPRVPPFADGSESRVREAIRQMPVDTAAEGRIARLEPLLPALARPGQGEPGPVELAVLGYRRIVPPAPVPEPEPVRVPEPFDYLVSMTYVSDDRRFAVIDGRFYREDSRLPGGERVLAISPSAVQIQRRDTTRWLEIEKEPEAISEKGGIIRTESSELGDGVRIPVERPALQSSEG